ncbi:7351_t:CDS:2 [Dentiscutata erythropus]|uniref:7351_t:CDS:1 n=1 Tax=Dentiscutata erythropus TaxID=1348616 RepID=A0A9N9ENZ4_9GLOM|nr:7351_t:CDS:2 [Dentiscutata erythropus]
MNNPPKVVKSGAKNEIMPTICNEELAQQLYMVARSQYATPATKVPKSDSSKATYDDAQQQNC